MKTMSVLQVPVEDIVANRYRNIKKYNISDDKIKALVQSYESTGFWDGSIQARPHPTATGKYEIAFGHHRLAAAKEHRLKSIGLVVSDLSNTQMLLMMAHENREEFKHDALVTVETIGEVIEAYGRGEIELEAPDEKRGNPVFSLPGGKLRYSLATVARFLGWVKASDQQATRACRVAFEAYHERAGAALARELPTDKRSSVAVESVIAAAHTARKLAEDGHRSDAEVERLARKAAVQQVEAIKKESGFKERQKARRIAHTVVTGAPPKLNIGALLRRLVKQVKARVGNDEELLAQWREVAFEAAKLPGFEVEQAAVVLVAEAERMVKLEGQLREIADRLLRRANIKNVTPAARRQVAQLMEGAV